MPNELLRKEWSTTPSSVYNLRITRKLDQMLEMVHRNIQRRFPDDKVGKYDLVRIAIQEFIERRPEFFDKDFNYQSFKYSPPTRKTKK